MTTRRWRPLFCGLCVVPFAALGCTTKINKMTDAYDRGQFAEAAIAGDEVLAVIRDQEGEFEGIKVEYERDRLWAGLEKAKILSDAGRYSESLQVFTHVYAEQEWLAELESSYKQNPFDVEAWDVGQFAEDAGQAVVGADQTTFLVQPYEAILAASYSGLAAMMSEEPVYAEFAASSMRLQGEWQTELGLETVPLRSAADTTMDTRLAASQSKLKGFSIASILNLDQFGKVRAQMAEVVEAATKANAASPFVASASLINWAAFVKGGRGSDALSAIEAFKAFSGNAQLASQLSAAASAKQVPNKVLVVVGAGRGPGRDYFSVRVPVPVPNVGTGYFRGVYPYLTFRGLETRPNSITASGTPMAIVTSIDALAAQDFSRREPSLWWTPTVRGMLRLIASLVGQAAVGSNSDLKALIQIGNFLVAEAEQADLRMWTSLPAVHFAAMIDRPADGKVVIDMSSRGGSGSITVEAPSGLSLVYVRALEPGLAAGHSAVLRAAPKAQQVSGSDVDAPVVAAAGR